MKLVVKLKLKTDPQTHRLLQQTVEQYQRACNFLSQLAFETSTAFVKG